MLKARFAGIRSLALRSMGLAIRGVVLVAIGWALYVNLRGLWPIVRKEIRFIVKNPVLSYDQKMSAKWGLYHDYMVFVRENTPPDAVIMTPPQTWPWLSEGNRLLDYYFLRPRILKGGGVEKLEVDEAATHVMIAWGSHGPENPEKHGWPKPPYPPGKVIWMPGQTERWGLIDLRENR